MNPLVLVRGVAYSALPVALGLASIKRKRDRVAADESDPGELDDEDYARRPSRAQANQRRAYLEGGGDPSRVELRYCNLSKICLAGGRLEGIDLSHAVLAHASLEASRLSGARLDYADLSKANMRNADLSRASLLETNLWKADLRGAKLAGCLGIGMANLRGAHYDNHTSWPNGFDPAGSGAVLVTRDTSTK